MPFFEIRKLSKHYQGQPVFSHLDLEIEAGQFVTLLGPSGCGKSTLLRCMAGLSRVDQGCVIMDGAEITHQTPQRRGIGMVFQNYALFPNLNVAQNIAFGLRMRGIAPREQHSRVRKMLELVELTGKESAMPDSLSGGQKQRVALARALVVRPKLLLLDEPLSALDAPIRRHLREQIRTIQRQLGLTTLFVTHDQEEALSLSDRLVLMNEGRIVQSGSAESLYTRPNCRFAAQFMGQYNLLSAQQTLLLFNRQISGQLAIRPESITLLPAHAAELTGRVRDLQLLGNVIRYHIECRGMVLRVDALNRDASALLPVAQEVGLSFTEAELCEVA